MMFLEGVSQCSDQSCCKAGTRYILSGQKEKTRLPCLTFSCKGERKMHAQMLSLTGFCCLMNFPPDPSDQRSVLLANEILQDAHRSCWGWSLSFMRLYQRPSQQGDTATHPNWLQISCNFYLPSLAQPTLHRADIKIQPSGIWWIK